MKKASIGITIGDPSGIGCEIAIKALDILKPFNNWIPVVFGDKSVIDEMISLLKTKIDFLPYNPESGHNENTVFYVDKNAVSGPVVYGIVDEEYGRAALIYLESAAQMALQGRINAIVTGPVNKRSLKRTKSGFIDQTSILKDLCGVNSADTMFLTGKLRIFFLTRHIPLKAVPASLTTEQILDNIKKCMLYLKKFGIVKPTLAVAALNPHAGDNGLIGSEEIEIIRPAVVRAQKELLDVRGPVPADSVFHLAKEGLFDAVLSLYHDQGHIAAKTLDFFKTVSLTLGLPFLRTSVDHGTAFDIAGKGIASPESMVEAIKAALTYHAYFK